MSEKEPVTLDTLSEYSNAKPMTSPFICIFSLTTVAVIPSAELTFNAKADVRLEIELLVGVTVNVSLKSVPFIVIVNSSPFWGTKIVDSIIILFCTIALSFFLHSILVGVPPFKTTSMVGFSSVPQAPGVTVIVGLPSLSSVPDASFNVYSSVKIHLAASVIVTL